MGNNLGKNAMENNETQNRRQFFKEAAKKALPIIGAVALLGNPVIAKAMESETMGCKYECAGACRKGCSTTCTGSCKNGCTSCSTTCTNTCKNTNKK